MIVRNPALALHVQCRMYDDVGYAVVGHGPTYNVVGPTRSPSQDVRHRR
jgi:hypothetical protein